MFQEFSLAPDLTVEENLLLGRESTRFGLLRKATMREQVRDALAALNFDLSPKARVADLSRAEQQMTEIAKALFQNIKLLILDEPTSSLTEKETKIAKLKHAEVGIIYVSHRMGEIKRIGDRLTVLRDGRKIGTVTVAEVNEKQLVEMMTGRTAGLLFPKKIEHRPQEVILQASDLSTAGGAVKEVNLQLRAGEVVGLAGLVGCGKSELARALFGLEQLTSGRISLFGTDLPKSSPASMLARGVCYFPSDRIAEGLALTRPLRENVSMAALDLPQFSWRGLLHLASERRVSQLAIQQLQIRPTDSECPVEFLSGGNRQKVMLARGIVRSVKVFLFDEPTVGVDVSAKAEIYKFLGELKQAGAAILLVSSELPELLYLSSRVYVMNRGRITVELQGDEIKEDVILSSFFERSGASLPSGAGFH